MKRILIFLSITFALSWIYEFAVVCPLANGDVSQSASMEVTFAIGAVMFFPAIGVVLTRLITQEGFKNCVIKPYPWRRSLPWFLVAWFGPSLLIAFGAATYFLLFPGDFDPQGSAFATMLESQAASAGVALELPSVAVMAAIQIAVGVFFGPLLNIATTFGEEWGWRGYLMPKLASRMRITPTLLISGVIWGLWHAPITALGHNYGLGYPGWPVTGVLAMCAFCVVCGIFLSYVTIRTGSCLAAAFGHGAINALSGASTIFAVAGTSPFVGPSPTGIIGGCGLIIVAAIMLADLRKRERDGTLRIPEAGTTSLSCHSKRRREAPESQVTFPPSLCDLLPVALNLSAAPSASNKPTHPERDNRLRPHCHASRPEMLSTPLACCSFPERAQSPGFLRLRGFAASLGMTGKQDVTKGQRKRDLAQESICAPTRRSAASPTGSCCIAIVGEALASPPRGRKPAQAVRAKPVRPS